MGTLLLKLAGPLQAWGVESKFDERRTLNFPTKSGVIGMVAAALGRSREESVEYLSKLKFGVRVDREGELLQDYHTAKGKNMYVTKRYYLADAIFLAGLESDDQKFLAQIETALKNPAFPLYLGRRSCVPTQPLVLGVRETDLLTALYNEPWLLPEWRQKKCTASERKLRIITDDTKNINDSDAILRDVPVSFNRVHREFIWRNVMEHEYVQMQATEHDPWAELR